MSWWEKVIGEREIFALVLSYTCCENPKAPPITNTQLAWVLANFCNVLANALEV